MTNVRWARPLSAGKVSNHSVGGATMKLTKMLVISFMLTIVITVKAQAQDITGHDEPIISSSAVSTLPDVIVESVNADDLDGGPVTVIVKNQGPRNAQRFDV